MDHGPLRMEIRRRKGKQWRVLGKRETKRKGGGDVYLIISLNILQKQIKINLASVSGNFGHNFEVCIRGLWQLYLPSMNFSSSLVASG